LASGWFSLKLRKALSYTLHMSPSKICQAALTKQALTSKLWQAGVSKQTLPRSSASGEGTGIRDFNEFQIGLCYRQVMSLSHGAWARRERGNAHSGQGDMSTSMTPKPEVTADCKL